MDGERNLGRLLLHKHVNNDAPRPSPWLCGGPERQDFHAHNGPSEWHAVKALLFTALHL